jgi:hypothetical protein
LAVQKREVGPLPAYSGSLVYNWMSRTTIPS